MVKINSGKNSSSGSFPNNWEKVEFGEFAEIIMGQSPEGSTYNQNGNGVALINGPTEFTERYPVKVQWTTSPTKICKTGDILLCVRGSSTGRLNIANEEYCIGRGVAAIRAKKNSDHTFLEFQIENIVNKILALTTGSTFPNIDSQSLRKIQVSLPPLPEQKAIANILSLMDNAINKNNLLIAKKKLQKEWLMQNLLTGKKRLKGVAGEWKETLLNNLFDRVTRKNTEVNTNVVTISAQRGFVRQSDFFNKTIASEILDNYFLVNKGEFCYNKSYSNGYPWGATKRLNDYDKAVVTTLYICFGIKDKKKCDGDFFEQYFEANLLDKGLTQIAHEGGRAHGLLNVTPFDFFSLKIKIPKIEEQTAIAQLLNAADKEIQLLKTKTEKLREQKKGLMQVLLTGKKRLKSDLK